MPLRFSDACLLLSRLEDIELRDPPFINPKEKSAQIKVVTEYWFKSHRRAVNELDIDSSVALISTFLPERRTDRVYGIQAKKFCRILSRCLSLSAARVKDLQAYEQPGFGDLATCVERLLKSGGPPAHPPVSLIEVDDMLQILAGLSPFSRPGAARLPPGSSENRDDVLGNIFKRLQPHEAKWLVRLILKDFSPIRVNVTLLLKSIHFLLPDLLQFQNDFRAAIELLKGSLKEYPECPDPRSERLHRLSARGVLKPVVGVKVGRPDFWKARSIDHCVTMLGKQKWVLERKYDGEYCEIHIDLSKSPKVEECITIFSKSGKDSTTDRITIHKTLLDCFGLGQPDCKIKRKAIILGELVAYSNEERRVLPFEEIRKHVLRSGRSIGTDRDSQAKPHEHLAIVLFDLLLMDDKIIMNKPIEERRMWLREIYKKLGGRAWSAEWKVVDFSDAKSAKKRLTEQFAASIAERCEGLILKPCDMPYFAFGSDLGGRPQHYIKLKKDYISDLGDEADFAVVGGTYSAQQAAKSGIGHLHWTDFHLGCLMNKADVLRFDAKPRFKVVGTIQQDQCIPKPILQAVNAVGNFTAKPYRCEEPPMNFDLEHDPSLRIQSVFETPLVCEVLGSGFEKPSNSAFLMLRHPRVKKLHEDRSWKDCVSMQELQEQAYAARSAGASESQETREWIEKLERKLRRKSDRQRTATPQSNATTTPGTGCTTIRSINTSAVKTNLDGTTLISESSRAVKRLREGDDMRETPCPATKRACTRHPNYTPSQHRTAIGADNTTPARPSPLSEITNNASFHAMAKPSTKTAEKADDVPSTHEQPRPHAIAPSAECTSPECPLYDAVYYLAPSLKADANITDSLKRHDGIVISDLQHWDRDTLAHPPLTFTVAESQAFNDRKKVILINRKPENWRHEFLSLLKQVGKLNGGQFREQIDFWDVEVLDKPCPHLINRAWWMDDESFLGNVSFDDRRGPERMLYLPRTLEKLKTSKGLVEASPIRLSAS